MEFSVKTHNKLHNSKKQHTKFTFTRLGDEEKNCLHRRRAKSTAESKFFLWFTSSFIVHTHTIFFLLKGRKGHGMQSSIKFIIPFRLKEQERKTKSKEYFLYGIRIRRIKLFVLCYVRFPLIHVCVYIPNEWNCVCVVIMEW